MLLGGVALVFVWSFIGCHDAFTWLLELLPVIHRRAGADPPLSPPEIHQPGVTANRAHATILIIGGYALMPVFEWIKQAWHLDRNYYDRLGHFAQGFVPALIAREVLLRTTPLKRGKMLTTLVMGVYIGISALYELFEFAAAKLTGTAADAFLGSQGDVWDTQWDMTWRLIGATCALLFMTRLHARSLAGLRAS